jgi:hypothetical protein
MKIKLIIALFLILGLFVLVGVVNAQTPEKFWAMNVGNHWVYNGSAPGITWQWKEQISGTELVQGVTAYARDGVWWNGSTWVLNEKKWFSITSSEMRFVQETDYESDNGLWYTSIFASPGILWLKNPMSVGETWPVSTALTLNEGTVPLGSDVSSYTFTAIGTVSVLASESVVTPLGTYKAYKVQHQIDIYDAFSLIENMLTQNWVVPYMGEIRRDEVVGMGPAESEVLSSMSLPLVFSDIPITNWAYHYTAGIYDDGITAGCAAGAYCPGNNVTREQMASFLVRAVDQADATTCLGTLFTDVPLGAPHCANIERLRELNVTLGCTTGMYCPSQNVLRDQMAAFLARAFLGMQ